MVDLIAGCTAVFSAHTSLWACALPRATGCFPSWHIGACRHLAALASRHAWSTATEYMRATAARSARRLLHHAHEIWWPARKGSAGVQRSLTP